MFAKAVIQRPVGMRFLTDIRGLIFGTGKEIHYIGGTEVLPPPLEEEEEQKMIRGLGSGDDSGAKNALIEHNLRLVVYIAKKFDNTGVGVEDLISIGNLCIPVH